MVSSSKKSKPGTNRQTQTALLHLSKQIKKTRTGAASFSKHWHIFISTLPTLPVKPVHVLLNHDGHCMTRLGLSTCATARIGLLPRLEPRQSLCKSSIQLTFSWWPEYALILVFRSRRSCIVVPIIVQVRKLCMQAVYTFPVA